MNRIVRLDALCGLAWFNYGTALLQRNKRTKAGLAFTRNCCGAAVGPCRMGERRGTFEGNASLQRTSLDCDRGGLDGTR